MRAVVMGAVAAVLGLSAAANAGVNIGIDIHSGPPAPRRVWVSPVYETRVERVWVPPVTQTVVQNVWHPAETRDQVTHTWVADRYEDRDIAERDAYGRTVIVRRTLLVQPAHWEDMRTPVEVRPGYYAPETQCVTIVPGHWDTVTRDVCVRSGYYDDCGPVYAPVYASPPPPYRPYGYHGGYDRGDRYRDHR